MRCAALALACERPAALVLPGTDLLLARLCSPHRRTALDRARARGVGLALAVESLCTPQPERPLCARCGVSRAARLDRRTRPGLAPYCAVCRYTVSHPAARRASAERRAAFVCLSRISKADLDSLATDAAATLALYADQRPRTRGDCLPGGCNAERPCPWASCVWHLALDVSPRGSLRIAHPDREVWELSETCALDVADRGGISLEEVGDIGNVTRERVRQIELRAREIVRPGAVQFVDHLDEDPAPPGRASRFCAPPLAASVDVSERVHRLREAVA